MAEVGGYESDFSTHTLRCRVGTPDERGPFRKDPTDRFKAASSGSQPAVKHAPAKKTVAKKAGVAAPIAKTVPSKKAAPAKKVVVKQASPPAAAKAAAVAPSTAAKVSAAIVAGAKAVPLSPDSAATIRKLADSLRKMGDKRPTRAVSLWRSLKSFLGVGATEESVEVALARLIEDGVVKVDSVKGASYPGF